MYTHACTHKQNNSMNSILLCVLNHSISLLKKRFFFAWIIKSFNASKIIACIYTCCVYVHAFVCDCGHARVQVVTRGQAQESVLTFHFA